MKNYILNIYSNFLLEEEINKLISKEENIINLNYDDLKIDDVILECSYYSLIDTSKCVIVKNFKLNEDARKLINYLENPNKDVKLILICSNYDKRNKIYKDIKGSCGQPNCVSAIFHFSLFTLHFSLFTFHFSPYIPIYHKSKIEHCLCDNECGTATIACIALDAMAHIGEKQEGGNG